MTSTPRATTSATALLCIALALVLTAALTGGVPPVAAQDGGPVPAEQLADRCGLDADLMQQADIRLAAHSYVVMRYGELCWVGGNPVGHQAPQHVWSMTKTFGGILVGLVITRSPLLEDTTPIIEWADPANLGDVNPDATVAHVLSMAGTNEDLSGGNRQPWSYDTLGDRELHLLREVMDNVIAADPESFDGAADADEVAQRFIFDVLGMPNTTWNGSMAGGMETLPVEAAKLGELILRRGVWDGQVLVDEDYMYRLTHPAFEDANTAYGYLTYLNADGQALYSTGTADHQCMPYTTWQTYPHPPFYDMADHAGGDPTGWPPAHDVGVVWAAGAGGQKMAVHRALDLVIMVRDHMVSDDPSDPGTFEGHKVAWDAVRPALLVHDPDFAGDDAAFCEAYRASAHAPDLREPWSPGAEGPLDPVVQRLNGPPADGAPEIIDVAEADASPTARSIAFSQLLFPDGAATEALYASDETFADALAAGGLQSNRPLLLGDPTQLDPDVTAELDRLGVSSVRILGGPAAVTDEVADALRAEGLEVARTAGATRLDTAAEIAALLEGDRTVVTRAFGDAADATRGFADSLAAGAWAADRGVPLLLTEQAGLSPATRAAVLAHGADRADVVGGVAAVGEQVAEDLTADGITPVRLAGDNRADTAVAVAAARGFTTTRRAELVLLVDGEAPDGWTAGFAGAGIAAAWSAPVLLAAGDDLPAETEAFLREHAAGASVLCAASTTACQAALAATGV